MARAAVRAKQAQQAQAQAATKPSRKQRKHASGGNPNQDLFFSRLRRRQKWVFVALAVVFAVSFVAFGVGSGNGSGLEQMYNSLFNTGNDPVGKAQADIKAGKVSAYKDLANAYISKNDNLDAINALESYLRIKKTDSTAWAQLGGLKKQQADHYAQEYQQVQQSVSLQSPGSIFQPTFGQHPISLGTNPIDDFYNRQNSALLTPLAQNARTGYTDSLAAFRQSAKYASPTDLPNAELAVYSASQLAGQGPVGLAALKRYVELVPDSPNLKQIEAACVSLGGTCVPKPAKKK